MRYRLFRLHRVVPVLYCTCTHSLTHSPWIEYPFTIRSKSKLPSELRRFGCLFFFWVGTSRVLVFPRPPGISKWVFSLSSSSFELLFLGGAIIVSQSGYILPYVLASRTAKPDCSCSIVSAFVLQYRHYLPLSSFMHSHVSIHAVTSYIQRTIDERLSIWRRMSQQ